PTTPTLFPYTTLFRSQTPRRHDVRAVDRRHQPSLEREHFGRRPRARRAGVCGWDCRSVGVVGRLLDLSSRPSAARAGTHEIPDHVVDGSRIAACGGFRDDTGVGSPEPFGAPATFLLHQMRNFAMSGANGES